MKGYLNYLKYSCSWL